tara:strand:- start:296 stop:742 length:447 start_codon:yes stop_codon:yes gene_type:complete
MQKLAFIFLLLLFSFPSKFVFSNNILNCPSCNLNQEFCKNCVKEKRKKQNKVNKIQEKKNSSLVSQNEQISDFLVCYRYGNYNGKYIKEAKLRGLNCTNQEQLKQKSSVHNKNPINKFTYNAEQKCEELGFSKGTEKFGDCVLKLLKF